MRTTISLRFAFFPVLVALVLSGGCENKVTLPTPDPQTQGYDVFFGPLDPLGKNNYLITLDAAATVQVMLAGVVLDNPVRSISPVLRVHLGSWDGTECVDLLTADVQPRLTASLQRQMDAGTHCVSVSDPGALSESVGIVVRVVAPVILRTAASPGTETFASAMTVNGRATRSVEASTAGRITLALTGLSTPNTPVGLALGIPATDNSSCALARVVTTLPGASPQLTADVDPGFYCMAVFDVGNFRTTQNFSVTITHP